MIKAYIISLKSQNNRRALMEDQIKHIEGIDFTFFDAITPQDERFLSYKSHWDKNFLTRLYRGKNLTLGEKACFASHYALWELCVKNQEEMLVLEDDIIFASDFKEKIDYLCANSFDFVRLMAFFEKKNFLLKDCIYQTFEDICGTQGYFLAPKSAFAFLQYAKLWFCPVDNYLDKSYLHGVKNLFIFPAIISENTNLQSSIDSMGGGDRKQKIGFQYKISKEILTALETIWRRVYGWKNYKR